MIKQNEVDEENNCKEGGSPIQPKNNNQLRDSTTEKMI